MTPQEELRYIQKELQRLNAEKARLEALRRAKLAVFKGKIGVLGQQIGNVGARAAAEHPLIFGAGEIIGETAGKIGKEAKPALKKLRAYIKKKAEEEAERRKKLVNV